MMVVMYSKLVLILLKFVNDLFCIIWNLFGLISIFINEDMFLNNVLNIILISKIKKIFLLVFLNISM